jgi:8-hydroxy-5-deazaflavin:NADPH oxidoreductase
MKDAVAKSQVVMLAVGVSALEEVMSAVGSLDGKIVITCVSGLQPDFTGQTIGLATNLETLATAWVQFAVASQLFPNLGLKALRR